MKSSACSRPATEQPPVALCSTVTSGPFRIVARAVPVDDQDRLVADHPGVVAARQRGDVTGAGYQLGAVVHLDRQAAADVVLEVRRLAALGARDRLDVI